MILCIRYILFGLILLFCSDYLELDERMHDLKSELEGYNSGEYDESHKKKALDALKRMENWNLFSDTSEVSFISISRDDTSSS